MYKSVIQHVFIFLLYINNINIYAIIHLLICLLSIDLSNFLNQARAGRRPARAWFLKIYHVRIVCMRVCVCVFACVCPPPRLLITSGVMWRDIDLIRLVKQVLQLLYGNCSRYR